MPLTIRQFLIDDDIADQPLSRTYKFILQMHRLNRCSHCGVTKQTGEHEWCATCKLQIKEGRLHRRHSKKAGTPGWLKALKPFKLKVLRPGRPPSVTNQIDELLDKTDLNYSAIARQLRCSRQLVNQRARFRGINAVERATTMRSDLLAYLEYDPPTQTEMRLVWDVAKKFGADVRRVRPVVCDHTIVPLLKTLIINGRSVRISRCSKLSKLGSARFHYSAANPTDFTILVLCTRLSGPVFYVVPDAVIQQYRGPDVIQIPVLTKRMQGVGGWWNEYINRFDLIIPSAASADGSVQLPPLALARPLPRRLRDPRLFPVTHRSPAEPPHSTEGHQQ